MKKSTKKTVGIVAVAVLLGVALSAIFGAITNGFQDFDIREVNPDNIINVESYVDNLDAEREDGLKIEVSEDGAITVSGKNKTEQDVKIEIQDVTLEVGKYTISSGAKNTDEKTYFLSIVNGEDEVIADTEDESTIAILANNSECTIYITICAGESVDTTFYPVLVEGTKTASFYVIGK